VLFIIGPLIEGGAKLRQWLYQLNQQAVEMLTFGQSPAVAALIAFGLLLVASLGGALLVLVWTRLRVGESVRKGRTATAEGVRSMPPVQAFSRLKYRQVIVFVIVVAILLVAPRLIGQYWNYTMGTVGIYILLGLGLNIVVGFAGLLDLGYVAFFAIGAYTTALLTAPTPHNIMMNFWPVVPIGIFLAAISGVLLGIPVMRMRGDYLAIVTLGFGEIIRILSKSDALTGFTGGPRGVRAIGGPSLFGLNLNNNFYFMYFIIIGIVLVIGGVYLVSNG